jgi:hypothetical protein
MTETVFGIVKEGSATRSYKLSWNLLIIL